jgi:SnoaL-like domain
MSVDLPKPIARYFAVENEGDAAALAQCFASDAVVRDEGKAIKGLAAIQQWKRETTAKYRHTIEPLACGKADGTIGVTCRLTGTFPGSPIDVQFVFALDGDRITSLEIHP